MLIETHDFHKQLSDEQVYTLSTETNSKCILASAGSGKTKTLVHHIIDDLGRGIKPEEIIAFTFTKKAASEILNRVSFTVKSLDKDYNLDGIFIGTIHSWCQSFLSKETDYLNYSPIDELQEYTLLARLYDTLKLKEIYNKHYPRGIKEFIVDLQIFYNENLENHDIPEILRDSMLTYQNILKRNRLINFGSMISWAVDRLIIDGGLSKIKCLYVDEYQDVNPVQVQLINAMVTKTTKLTVVGDDLQCIYNWRGSDVTKILNFTKDFASSKLYRLNTNFRSSNAIVEIANSFSLTISNRDKIKKMEAFHSGKSEKVLYVSCNDKFEQAEKILQTIQSFLNKGVKHKEIAVLLRSIKNSSHEIIEVLQNNGIPIQCSLIGRGTEYVFDFIIPLFEWVSDLSGDPKNIAEENALDEKANRLLFQAKKYSKNKELDDNIFWDTVEKWTIEIENQTDLAYNIRLCLYNFLSQNKITVCEEDSEIINAKGILSQIIRSSEETHRRRLEGIEKKLIKDVYIECIGLIHQHYFDFGESLPIDYVTDGILISTVHQAKGLEWPIVILPSLDKKLFPVRERNFKSTFPTDIAKRYGTTLDDERRLFYVALTRAKERLILMDCSAGCVEDSSIFIQNLINSSYHILRNDFPAANNNFWITQQPTKEPTILRIGLSDILIFMDCPFQFGLRRKAQIQPQIGDELGYGKGLHEVIQVKFNGTTNDANDKLIESHIHLPYQSLEKENEAKKAIKERIEMLQKLGLFNFKVIAEQRVEVYFEDVVVEGIIDGILDNEDGTYKIIDWKSNVHEEYIERYKNQLLFYVFALRKKGFNIKDAIIINVGESFRQKKIVSLEVTISDNEINDFMRILKDNVKNIMNNKFPAIPSLSACTACDIALICSKNIN